MEVLTLASARVIADAVLQKGRELARRADRMPGFFVALNAMPGGRVVAVPGLGEPS
jgi:hypothetical protein